MKADDPCYGFVYGLTFPDITQQESLTVVSPPAGHVPSFDYVDHFRS
jgi:hypothetical protein